MLAPVFHGPGEPLRVESVEVQDPQRGEVLVEMKASGVCHSDYHVVVGEWGSQTPLVLGHEGAGVVVGTGPGVTNLAVGDAVALSWTPSCRRCRYCVTGRPALCTTAVETAYQNVLPDGTTRLSMDGTPVFSYLSVASFGELAVVPESGAIPIPSDVDPAIAALVGCAVTTGIGAVINTASVEAGATVAVLGCGGVGLSVLMGAVLTSASEIIAVDVSDEKLRLAEKVGATTTINASQSNVVDAILDVTGGRGVDCSFEAIGRAATIEQAYECLAPGGTAVVVGQVPTGVNITIDPMVMSGRELTLKGCNYGSARPSVDFGRILDFHQRGVIDLELLVSERVTLDEVNSAFDSIRDGSGARTVIEFRR